MCSRLIVSGAEAFVRDDNLLLLLLPVRSLVYEVVFVHFSLYCEDVMPFRWSMICFLKNFVERRMTTMR